MVRDLLAECDSFERRGPKAAAVINVSGSHVDVLRSEIEWSALVGNKPIVDNRTDNISDLIPTPRMQMNEIMQGFSQKLESLGASQPPRPKGPRM